MLACPLLGGVPVPTCLATPTDPSLDRSLRNIILSFQTYPGLSFQTATSSRITLQRRAGYLFDFPPLPSASMIKADGVKYFAVDYCFGTHVFS
ncbi:hypothetical protein EV401DRAFT_1942619 [Pisolithus croceorrhizus]|nr:hypothetical protein EV401DRAFT_1942619 [Pisolithus croceorrhizus]